MRCAAIEIRPPALSRFDWLCAHAVAAATNTDLELLVSCIFHRCNNLVDILRSRNTSRETVKRVARPDAALTVVVVLPMLSV